MRFFFWGGVWRGAVDDVSVGILVSLGMFRRIGVEQWLQGELLTC